MDEQMGFPRRFIGIIFGPGRVFESLRTRPSFLAPILLVAIVAASSLPLLAPLNAQLIEQQMRKNPQISQEQIDQAIARSQSAWMTGVQAGSAFVAIPLVLLFYTFLFRTIFNIGLGGDASFKAVFSMVSHANLISVLGLLVIVPLSLYRQKERTLSMPIRTKIMTGIIVVAVIGTLVIANIRYQRKQTGTVQTQRVERRDLTARVSASGKIETTRKVDVSASISGKVVRLAVQEGQTVDEGQLLLQIDPTPTQTAVAQLQASIRSAGANLSLAEANLNLARTDYERQQALLDRNVVAVDVVQRAKSAYDVEVARYNAAKEEIARLEASLRNAKHDLTKVNVLADIAGVVTKLNIHEGENAFVGTFNNPGTVLMTVSNLNRMEAWVEVDETDVVDLRIGQPAEILVDAYPDTVFHGVVERIGNSPITATSSGGDRQSINFEVVIVLTDKIPNVRPGLSCVADIITGRRTDALAIPIQALTVRAPSKEGETADERQEDTSIQARRRNRDHEGVFVVENDRAIFRPVLTGLTGERRFEALSGLEEGMEVVTGPFETLRTMKDSALVKVENPKPEE